MISYKERMKVLYRESSKTMEDTLNKLSEDGRVLVVRPTGFGKTYLLVKLAETYIKKFNKRVLYLYPNDIIVTELRNNNEYDQAIIDKYFVFKSYQEVSLIMGNTLSNSSKRQSELYNEIKDNYSIILLDEVHRCASSGFMLFYDLIDNLIGVDKTHIIGVTATPNRMEIEETEELIDKIFKNISVYKYDLGDAFEDGLLPEIKYGCRQYNLEELVQELKKTAKNKYERANVKLNEDCFNMEIAKFIEENGTEGDFIYTYIKEAGYDLASDDCDQSYLKFIVFFSNAQDMLNRGEEVEQWFYNAVNTSARNDLGFDDEFIMHVDYVISSTADCNADYGVRKLAEKKSYRSYITDASKIGQNSVKSAKRIDLIFNINVINMGYHVDDISGIMMLRATKSEIIYYQQLGRCLSVKSTKSPIVLDIVQNISVNFNPDKRKCSFENLLLKDSSALSDKDTLILDDEYFESTKDNKTIKVFSTGHRNKWLDLKSKLLDINYSRNFEILYLYTDRMCPICVIAENMNMSCSDIAILLIKSNIKLREEDGLYNFYEKDAKSNNNSNEFRLMKYIYSKDAFNLYSGIRNTSQSLYKSICSLINKVSGGK